MQYEQSTVALLALFSSISIFKNLIPKSSNRSCGSTLATTTQTQDLGVLPWVVWETLLFLESLCCEFTFTSCRKRESKTKRNKTKRDRQKERGGRRTLMLTREMVMLITNTNNGEQIENPVERSSGRAAGRCRVRWEGFLGGECAMQRKGQHLMRSTF